MAKDDFAYKGFEDLLAAGYTAEDLSGFLQTSDFADLKGATPDQVRNAARSDAEDSLVAYKIFGTILLDPEDETNAAWEPSAGGGGRRREDGRTKREAYLNNEEWEAFKTEFVPAHGIPEDAIVEKKRATRKAKAKKEEAQDPGLDSGESDQNPFAEFGA